jgi:hypothetical protein
MKTADGIAIIELQDRRPLCLAMMCCNWLFLLNATPLWYPSSGQRWIHIIQDFIRDICFYTLTILTLWWDGLASCLRTREFGEFIKLAEDAALVHRYVIQTAKPLQKLVAMAYISILTTPLNKLC